MAVGLAMALVAGVAQLLIIVAQQRHQARQYAAASREAGNLMESLMSRSWDDTTSKSASVELSEGIASQLPEGSVSVEVADEDQGVRRITLQIEWESGPERARESVRLVGWKFQAGEEGT